MNRRTLLHTAIAAGLTPTVLLAGFSRPARASVLAPSDHPLQASWRAWKAAHLRNDGRVVDGPQGGVSHSEGQGYGMTLAALFGDAETFQRMFDWTERRLAVRRDGLLAWRWLPNADAAVPDLNNASDGDLFFAWALMLGARAFDAPLYMERAREICADLVAKCVVASPADGRLVLLPAVDGFVTETALTFNPSYLMPRAMLDLAEAADAPILAMCARDGLALLQDLAEAGPVLDWVELTETSWRAPAQEPGPRSGYEALRTPLFLAWSGVTDHSAMRRAIETHAAAAAPNAIGVAPQTPTVFDGATGAVLERSAHPGYAAIAALSSCAHFGGVGSAIPPFDADQPYYPATLHLFAMLAQIERFPQCAPV